MKKHILLQSTKSVILSSLCAGVLLSETRAEDIFIQNSSFEDFTTGGEFTLETPFAWELYNPSGLVYGGGNDFVDGALNLDIFGSPWFNEPAPDGTHVLLLYTPPFPDTIGEFGVEQTLSTTLEGNSRYVFQVDVGNIQSGTAQNGIRYNFDGFPGYRVQLLANGTVIYEDYDELAPEEGEFLTSDCVFEIPSDSTFVGASITIRLTNLNLDVAGRNEVDFDHVRLTREPIGTVTPGLIPSDLRITAPVDSGEGLIQSFTISGKGKKRVLIVGRGLSLHNRVPNRIADPSLTIYGRKGIIGKSANWMGESHAREIQSIPQFTRDKWHRNDAGIILDLEPGEYSIALKNAQQSSGIGTIEVYDLDRSGNSRIDPLDKAAAELNWLWNRK